MVKGVDGQTITLKYKDGEKKIIVPPDTVIVTYAPGSKDELKPGAKIFIAAANKKEDGTLEAACHLGRPRRHRAADVRMPISAIAVPDVGRRAHDCRVETERIMSSACELARGMAVALASALHGFGAAAADRCGCAARSRRSTAATLTVKSARRRATSTLTLTDNAAVVRRGEGHARRHQGGLLHRQRRDAAGRRQPEGPGGAHLRRAAARHRRWTPSLGPARRTAP